MRVQRTRSSPSAVREPLTRHPLGNAGQAFVLGPVLVFGWVLGCASSTTYSDSGAVRRAAAAREFDLGTVHCVRVTVTAANPSEKAEILHRLIRELEEALPGVSFVTDESSADLEITFQRDDWMMCVDCDQLVYRTQYWYWSMDLSHPEFNAKCGVYESKSVGWLSGETWKLGERPEKAAARDLRSILIRPMDGA